jgi:adenosine deaminase
MCPLSNLKLRVVDDLKHHPLRRMMDKDVLVTVNSDDPAYFGGYVSDNYRAVRSALDLSRDELIAVARNSFVAAMMPEADRRAALAQFDAAVAKAGG